MSLIATYQHWFGGADPVRTPQAEQQDTMFEPDDHPPEPIGSDGKLLSRAVEHIEEAPRVNAVFRPFSLVSFLAITVTAILLATVYRTASIENIEVQTEASNVVMAQAAIAALHEDIADYLSHVDDLNSKPLPEAMAQPLYAIAKDTKVRRVKIYDRHGVVFFSTDPAQIGRAQSNNPRFARALRGETVSLLAYRDRFNSLGPASPEDNLVQSYIPLQKQHAGPYLGVFEIYTDVSDMVARNEQTQIIIVATVVLILMLLYFSLRAFVSRMERIISGQEEALRERSELLAALLARLLDTQENEKHRVAAELHERVAQTLAAVKLSVEAAVRTISRGEDGTVEQLQSMIPVLQNATQDVRTVAVGLRPPSLDDLGLVATLRWLCREMTEKHPQVRLESRIDAAQETSIPDSLKAIIFRIAEDSGTTLYANAGVTRIALSLDIDRERIVLTVRDDALATAPMNKDHPYAAVRERTLLSGGQFTTFGNAWGGLNMMATWLI